MVFDCCGFGMLAYNAPFSEPKAVIWKGAFDAILDQDPGANHAGALRDIVLQHVELGGDPFYFYDLLRGTISRGSAANLSAFVLKHGFQYTIEVTKRRDAVKAALRKRSSISWCVDDLLNRMTGRIHVRPCGTSVGTAHEVRASGT